MSSGDQFDIVQGNRETITGTLHDPDGATGHVLTVQADKSVKAQAGGGGAAPVEADYSGNAVSIADGISLPLTWDALDYGTDLLDRSTPSTPLFLADGFYAITVSGYASALTAGGTCYVTLGGSGGLGTANVTAQVAAPCIQFFVSICGQFAAGDPLPLTVQNADGVASRNFTLQNATVVKLA